MQPFDERSYAFVVRLWEERRDLPDAPPAWRGTVEDVRQGTRISFRSLAELDVVLRVSAGMNAALQPQNAQPTDPPRQSPCAARRPLRTTTGRVAPPATLPDAGTDPSETAG